MYIQDNKKPGKQNELEFLLFEEQFDFVGILQTWLDRSQDWAAVIE